MVAIGGRIRMSLGNDAMHSVAQEVGADYLCVWTGRANSRL